MLSLHHQAEGMLGALVFALLLAGAAAAVGACGVDLAGSRRMVWAVDSSMRRACNEAAAAQQGWEEGMLQCKMGPGSTSSFSCLRLCGAQTAICTLLVCDVASIHTAKQAGLLCGMLACRQNRICCLVVMFERLVG
jgi:hypothetical protein